MTDPEPPPSANPTQIATLLVSCPDRKGIVAALAQLLYGHGANILDADQHTDLVAGQFFQRVRFDYGQIHTDRLTLERGIGEVADRFRMRWRLAYAGHIKRLAIFVSRYDHCLYDLLIRFKSGELACEIPLVVGNHETMANVAAQFSIPFVHVPVPRGDKEGAERRQLELLAEHKIDVLVLARYMQVLSKGFFDRYTQPIINIHHSFLPAFVGQKPYHQAHESGVKLIGATAHYVTVDLDEGPIIEQDVLRTSHRDAVEDLVRKGRDVEKTVLGRAVRWHLEDRVLVYGNKTVVFA
jgi:formyltetrahydrofolate deformylase